jgi:hypothetical protein
MSCDCGCGDWNLSKADVTVLKQLREGVLADLPMSIWQSLIVDVEKAGGVLAVEGTAGKVIREAVQKASLSPAWQRKEGKNPSGGLNKKGRDAYARETGGKLKPPVKEGDNPRRASFLARMGNAEGPERNPDGSPTRLLLSLQAWGASSKEDARTKAKAISARNEAVEKAKFASRSEAARYAAQQRWKGHAKEGDSKTTAPRPTSGSKGRAGKKIAPKPSSSAGRGDGTDVVGQEGTVTERFGEMSANTVKAFSEKSMVKAGLNLVERGYGQKEATAAEIKLGADARDALIKILAEQGGKAQEALDNIGKGFMPELQISILERVRGSLNSEAKASDREAKEKGLFPAKPEDNTVGSMVYTSKRTVLENASRFIDLEIKRANASLKPKKGEGEVNDFIDFPDAQRDRRNTERTTLRVNGKSRTYQPTKVKASQIVKGDIVRNESEVEPRKVVAFGGDTRTDTSVGKAPVVLITQSLDGTDGKLQTSSSSGDSKLLRFDEVVDKAMPQGAGDPRSNAGRYAAEQRWKGHTKKTEIDANLRQQGKKPIAGGETNQDPSGDVIDTLVEALSQYKAGNQVVVPAESVYTVLEELAAFAKDAKDKGDKATDLDLCKVSVPGTNLFCGENKGLLREEMPQLSGVPTKGSKADGMEKDKKGRANIGEAFVEHLRDGGVETREGEVLASSLKATQKQVIGADVAGIMKALEDGSMPEQTLFVSRDGYVIDGHHRWAAAVGLDYKDGKAGDLKMKVRVIDLSIDEVLKKANAFADEMGMPRRSGDANADAKRKDNDDEPSKGDGKGKDKKKSKGKKTEG